MSYIRLQSLGVRDRIYTAPMLIVSTKIADKIARPDHGGLTRKDVEECFLNRTGQVVDNRPQHSGTLGPTWWFVAPNHAGKVIKVMYVEDDEHVYLRSAYLATDEVEAMYERKLRKN